MRKSARYTWAARVAGTLAAGILAAGILAAGILAAGILAAGTLAAGTLAEDWKIEKLDWTGALGEAREVVITNPHGDVRCRAADGDEVVVVANVQRHRDDPRRAAVDVGVGETPERLVVAVTYSAAGDAAAVTAEMEKRRVDVTVLVPHAARLVVETDRGLIEAKGLSRHLEADTSAGKVLVKTSSTVDAHSERGTIDVTFASTSWDDVPSRLETLTGDVSVWLPPQASITVEARTQGELSTDYSIEIDRRPPNDKKHAVARVGGAEGRLEIETETGRVRLLRSRF